MELNAYTAAPLAMVMVVAVSTVTVVWIALRGTAPLERAGILRAVADLIHAIRRIR